MRVPDDDFIFWLLLKVFEWILLYEPKPLRVYNGGLELNHIPTLEPWDLSPGVGILDTS